MKKKIVLLILVIAALVFGFKLYLASLKVPSNDRDWSLDDQVLPYAEFNNNLVTIYNVRDFEYFKGALGEISSTPKYNDKVYNLDKIDSAWFVVSPFSSWRGLAHTFVSFGFENGEHISISVEVRTEEGVEYSPWTGLFNEYELIYQIGEERDFVKLRTNYREGESVHLYPMNTTKERMRAALVAMLERANSLKETPEFYNTATSNCTSNLVDHVNQLVPDRVPKWSFKVLFPGYSDRLAYKLGLIDTDLEWDEVRDYYHINDTANSLDPNLSSREFSKAIREY